MNHDTLISDILKPLSEVKSQAYISDAIQVADIIEWTLSQFPEGSMPVVCQTTFSISEEFLRRLNNIKKRFPAKFVVIIDRKAMGKIIQLWSFIRNVYDEVYVGDNHSKILLVTDSKKNSYESGNLNVAVVTSQNLTRGNRHESAVISTDPEIFYNLMTDFKTLKNEKTILMKEMIPENEGGYVVPSSNDSEDIDIFGEIERLASFFVPISDIATVLDLDPVTLRDSIADPESQYSLAYRRGKTKAKIAIRVQEMEQARIGSPLGLQSVRDNLLMMEQDED